MLNRELSHFAESSKSGTQVSQFLINTYMDKEDDEPQLPSAEAAAAEVRFSLNYTFFFEFSFHFSNLSPII
ncbi:unnamed protein product [Anisakis simplex]|uniref:3',5'-cyclic-AMP phosphodiesterase n=1 Tax=Anisakis simplex TaxID=6269 RepID=A0A0M3J4S2_ANISI|nr:unnamed protein product [Anisakis simplex]